MKKYLVAAAIAVAGFVVAPSAAYAATTGVGCTFYKLKTWNGDSFFAKGGKQLQSLAGIPPGGGNNDISSVDCNTKCNVLVFDGEAYSGASKRFKNAWTLGSFDNKPSSLKVVCRP